MPPGIQEIKCKAVRKPYGTAIDILSLRVVMLRLLWGPLGVNSNRTQLCRDLVARLQRDIRAKPNDLKQLLLDKMLVMDPGVRLLAREYFESGGLSSPKPGFLRPWK